VLFSCIHARDVELCRSVKHDKLGVNENDLPDATASTPYSAGKRRTQGFPPKAAALYCAGGSAASGCGGTGHDPLSAQKFGLLEFAEDYELGGIELVSGLDCVGQGAEHQVYFDAENGLAIKVTHSGTYGHSAFERGFAASPADYLQRLDFHNWLFPNETKIIGIVLESAQIIINQQWVPRTAACTPNEIDDYLEKRGFSMFPIDERDSGHFNATNGLVILDASPGNVIKSGNHLFPIDLVIGYPGPALLDKVKDSLQG
jgi:Serine/Threonine/Tyrosine Kinase found in polyvalent proteins